MTGQYKERRKHPRYPCDTGVRIHLEKGGTGFWGTLSDISYGGCYIYTFSPLPIGQSVLLVIKCKEKDIHVASKVVSSHPGVGMGVAFQGFAQNEGEALLKAYLGQLASVPKTSQELSVFH
jgi:hypothetical protein